MCWGRERLGMSHGHWTSLSQTISAASIHGVNRGAHGVTEEVSDPRTLLDDSCQTGPSHVEDLKLLLHLSQLRLQGFLQGEEVGSFGHE